MWQRGNRKMLDKTRDETIPPAPSPTVPKTRDPDTATLRRRPAVADTLRDAVHAATRALLATQRADGHWCYELEADCTIPAEYILMMHFMDEIDEPLQNRMAVYLRPRQNADGGWPLYQGGASDISCTVKSYYALKLAGDSVADPHMRKAREAVQACGGAERSNVFTRYMLAMFGQLPWCAVPYVPVEVMLLPRWFPFHILKISYWSRTVMVPLAVLYTLKARAANPRHVGIEELLSKPADRIRDFFPIRSPLNRFFLWIERIAGHLDRFIPAFIRRRALQHAKNWVVERLNGTDGLGAIFPAMINAYEMLAKLGYPPTHPLRRQAKAALQNLVVDRGDYAYCQPSFSPVWDSALAVLALGETRNEATHRAAGRALDWLRDRQLLDEPGDWRLSRPNLAGGGWPFQYGNSFYPDFDDTAAVGWAMVRTDAERYRFNIERAAQWLAGMQCRNGGFASFDVNNTYYYLNEIPFADHGALLDPPTADVTARVVTFLALHDRNRYSDVIDRALSFLRREQEANGSWFGRWGTNYLYGTWSVLAAFEAAGIPAADASVRRAVAWLAACQRPDDGWGETNDSYFDPRLAAQNIESNAFQTAWALLALMAADETNTTTVRRGLQRRQQPDGGWRDASFTAPGFPRVFYLKYHSYDQVFPLWALSRYARTSGLTST